MTRMEKGVLYIRGKDGYITVPAKSVRRARAVRNVQQADCSAHWVEVTYENAQGLLQSVMIEASDASVAEMLARQAADYVMSEMGRDYEED